MSIEFVDVANFPILFLKFVVVILICIVMYYGYTVDGQIIQTPIHEL